jgi:hypothetical protein
MMENLMVPIRESRGWKFPKFVYRASEDKCSGALACAEERSLVLSRLAINAPWQRSALGVAFVCASEDLLQPHAIVLQPGFEIVAFGVLFHRFFPATLDGVLMGSSSFTRLGCP